MRLFLAINPDERTRRAISESTAELRAEVPEARWTDSGKIHLTLKFLGEAADDAADKLRSALDEVSQRHRQFTMRIGHVGAFPNFRRARVVWLGVEAEPRLELLHHDVEVACEARGFVLDGRPFRPHLTLARVPEGLDVEVLRRMSRAAKRIRFTVECEVESVDLMKSTLARGPGGAAHEMLHSAPLRSR